MVRSSQHHNINPPRGHCVICGAPGTSPHNFICSDCGDPLEATLYCTRCGRRLRLSEDAAMAFLEEYGFGSTDVRGIVFKVSGCSRCLRDNEVADVVVFRIRVGAEKGQ